MPKEDPPRDPARPGPRPAGRTPIDARTAGGNVVDSTPFRRRRYPATTVASEADSAQQAGNTHRDWPTRHGGGYPLGWRVRYRRRTHRDSPCPATQAKLEEIGTVAGCSLRDEHTGTTWVPIRADSAPAGAPAHVVRAADILDAEPPARAPN